MVIRILAIAAGGVIGTLLRFGLSRTLHLFLGVSFPYGTLLVNTLGCFIIGFFSTLAQEHGVLSPNIRDFLFIGLCGALTTFSTWIFESVALLRDNSYLLASTNIVLSLFLGLFAFYIGFIIARII